MAGRGWFIMYRGWMSSDDFRPEPFSEREVFIWSIENAAHSPHFQWFNGLKIFVERGEFATSIRMMAQRFSWTEKRVRTFMERMCRVQKWARRTAQSGAQSPTILTVCNYNEYQFAGSGNGTAEGTSQGIRRAHGRHIAGTQQDEWGKNGIGMEDNEWNLLSPMRKAELEFLRGIPKPVFKK
ncbi:hypothetical protein LZ518_11580 [Sphingomonas sp. RB56-2]|uniref:Uncharacterized protein n=1 Tax=Sphingomonas brevis TaxID=2908206 RepID=A0ABT0SBL1_9SPHN|nr:hypothetical protein [Sphingomonas brevis]MCL6741767.1 hypothetical protein [Sphingomonas brevis]